MLTIDRSKLRPTLAQAEARRAKPYDDATGKELRPGKVSEALALARDSHWPELEAMLRASMLQGKLTVGVGRNLTDVGLAEPEIDQLLENDIERHARELEAALPWVAQMEEPRQRAMLELAFNLGVGIPGRSGLLAFAPTLEHARRGEYSDVVKHLQATAWCRQVGDGPGGRFDRADRIEQMLLTGRDSV